MRLGPKPLPFQLGMASLASAGLAGGSIFDEATLQDFFKGIQKYQAHPFEKPPLSLEVVWNEGQARLLRAPTSAISFKTPVLLLPSMINKSDILDLLPNRSLMRFLAANGFETYLYDWGQPALDDGQVTFDKALQERLLPALKAVGRPVVVLGYCMGGLFSAALCALTPENIHGHIMLATPWDFHAGDGALKNRLSIMNPMAANYMAQYNRLPDSWLQAVFASLDPEASIRKFANFARLDGDEAKEELFVAVEDWLNDGIDLPSGIAKTCLQTWYEKNEPSTGRWQVCGQGVIAKDIAVPTLVIAAETDKIVPVESAIAFARQNEGARSIVCKTGHVGLLTGAKAMQQAWKPIADWCAAQQ